MQILRHVQPLQQGVGNKKMSGNCWKGMLHNMFELHKKSNICLQHGGGHSIYVKVSHVILRLSVLDTTQCACLLCHNHSYHRHDQYSFSSSYYYYYYYYCY